MRREEANDVEKTKARGLESSARGETRRNGIESIVYDRHVPHLSLVGGVMMEEVGKRKTPDSAAANKN